jgi:hypothetical protein
MSVTRGPKTSANFHKATRSDADSMGMKLSAEQAQRAHDYLQRKGSIAVNPLSSLGDVSPEVIERAMSCIAHTPDLRADRVAEAASVLDGRLPTASEVADRIVWRTLADSIR